MSDTDMINKLDKRYELVGGRDYFLYESKQSGKFISFIEPHEWTASTQPEKYIGWFILCHDGTWMRKSLPTTS